MSFRIHLLILTAIALSACSPTQNHKNGHGPVKSSDQASRALLESRLTTLRSAFNDLSTIPANRLEERTETLADAIIQLQSGREVENLSAILNLTFDMSEGNEVSVYTQIESLFGALTTKQGDSKDDTAIKTDRLVIQFLDKMVQPSSRETMATVGIEEEALAYFGRRISALASDPDRAIEAINVYSALTPLVEDSQWIRTQFLKIFNAERARPNEPYLAVATSKFALPLFERVMEAWMSDAGSDTLNGAFVENALVYGAQKLKAAASSRQFSADVFQRLTTSMELVNRFFQQSSRMKVEARDGQNAVAVFNEMLSERVALMRKYRDWVASQESAAQIASLDKAGLDPLTLAYILRASILRSQFARQPFALSGELPVLLNMHLDNLNNRNIGSGIEQLQNLYVRADYSRLFLELASAQNKGLKVLGYDQKMNLLIRSVVGDARAAEALIYDRDGRRATIKSCYQSGNTSTPKCREFRGLGFEVIKRVGEAVAGEELRQSPDSILIQVPGHFSMPVGVFHARPRASVEIRAKSIEFNPLTVIAVPSGNIVLAAEKIESPMIEASASEIGTRVHGGDPGRGLTFTDMGTERCRLNRTHLRLVNWNGAKVLHEVPRPSGLDGMRICELDERELIANNDVFSEPSRIIDTGRDPQPPGDQVSAEELRAGTIKIILQGQEPTILKLRSGLFIARGANGAKGAQGFDSPYCNNGQYRHFNFVVNHLSMLTSDSDPRTDKWTQIPEVHWEDMGTLRGTFSRVFLMSARRRSSAGGRGGDGGPGGIVTVNNLSSDISQLGGVFAEGGRDGEGGNPGACGPDREADGAPGHTGSAGRFVNGDAP